MSTPPASQASKPVAGHRKTGKPAAWVPGGALASYEGVLRDGRRITWNCGHDHERIYEAQQCAASELHTRKNGMPTAHNCRFEYCTAATGKCPNPE